MTFGYGKSAYGSHVSALWLGWISYAASLPESALRKKILSRFDELKGVGSQNKIVPQESLRFSTTIAWNKAIEEDCPETLLRMIEIGFTPEIKEGKQFKPDVTGLFNAVLQNVPRCIKFLSQSVVFKEGFKKFFKEDANFSNLCFRRRFGSSITSEEKETK